MQILLGFSRDNIDVDGSISNIMGISPSYGNQNSMIIEEYVTMMEPTYMIFHNDKVSGTMVYRNIYVTCH